MQQHYRLTTLDNGLTVVSESVPGVRSASVGIWVRAGSRHEAAGDEGAAHFLEHMAFKGTSRRSALDIARELDRLGGLANAFTGRENTCFHTRVVDTELASAFDILADMVSDPLIAPADVELEREVVLQEIAMVADTPEELAHELAWDASWSDTGLGHCILGSEESVKKASARGLADWRAARYVPGRMLVSAAGSIDHDALVAMAERALGGLNAAGGDASTAKAEYRPFAMAEEQDIEQSHLLAVFPSVSSTSPDRFAHALLNALLGGQMSSRLFQEIREKRGLAYSVYSSVTSLADAGAFTFYAAVAPERVEELARVMGRELRRAAAGDISEEELAHCRDNLSGLLYLGAESTEDRMIRLARNILLFGRPVPYDETAAAYAAVTLDDVRRAARGLRPEDAGVLLLGPEVGGEWREAFREELAG